MCPVVIFFLFVPSLFQVDVRFALGHCSFANMYVFMQHPHFVESQTEIEAASMELQALNSRVSLERRAIEDLVQEQHRLSLTRSATEKAVANQVGCDV